MFPGTPRYQVRSRNIAKPPVDLLLLGHPAQSTFENLLRIREDGITIFNPCPSVPLTYHKILLDFFPMNYRLTMKKLAHTVYRKGQIRVCQCKVLEGSYHTIVLRSILGPEGHTIYDQNFFRGYHGSAYSFTLFHVRLVQDVLGIPFQSYQEAFSHMCNFHTEEIVHIIEIFKDKLLIQLLHQRICELLC
jgi:hypothetical protein